MARLAALLTLFSFAAVAGADELRLLSGKNLSGELSAISATELTLTTPAGPVRTLLTQVLALDVRPAKAAAPAKYHQVRLLDDSVLRCIEVAYEGKEVVLTLASGTRARLPIAAVASLLRDAQEPALQKQWDRLDRQNVRRDRIFIARDGDLNPVEGTLGDVDAKEQTVRFTREGAGPVALPLARLAGFAFHRAEVPAESPVCRVIDLEGSILAVVGLSVEGDTLTASTLFGAKVPFKRTALSKLDFNLGRLTYLSDLDAKLVASPLLGGFHPIRRDVNLDGNPIILLDKQYAKGLSSYAGVELTYPLAGRYKEFKAVLGADPRIAEEGQGKVTVSVYCDGEKRLQKEVSASEIQPLAVNVKDVASLRIVVAGPNFTPFAGTATLADARVSQ